MKDNDLARSIDKSTFKLLGSLARLLQPEPDERARSFLYGLDTEFVDLPARIGAVARGFISIAEDAEFQCSGISGRSENPRTGAPCRFR
ncbi:MAG: hypothetical protein IT452_13785 [Planctomycetia bacterium]|nr:hypothetical protein [Planctomycetia bacterium]